ncbi:acetoacetate decarboxylase [Salinisphaera sp.]|uniref:acetoacetate decarboxylase n=1 Tax=Salinisphaera sp. TaxID=1914330 RepID=UPI002D772425|nr:acetoacetate decarboxylase [Salinisphaera sp.]HET7313957.1 acetoacetate decarboxylase [Salinisphaera sp.]
MTESEVIRNAFAMPLASPSYPRGPYRFIDREYLIVTYWSDPERLEQAIPAPLKLAEPKVSFEFMRMPNSTGFGDYCECGQTIPVTFNGRSGGFSYAMYLNDEAPTAGGREIWGFPKKLANPSLSLRKDTLVGKLDYQDVRVATATMGYKHETLDADEIHRSMISPSFLLKIIPHVDGTRPRICELVEYAIEDLTVKGAWSGPGALELGEHALAPVAHFPVREIVSTTHILTDLTLPYGEVVHDYLA